MRLINKQTIFHLPNDHAEWIHISNSQYSDSFRHLNKHI